MRLWFDFWFQCYIPFVPKNFHLFIFWITLVKNQTISIMFGVLNPDNIWHENLTLLSTSPVRCSHFTLGNPKKSFFNVYYTYISKSFMLPQKKANSNCCTAALAVYLLLFSASYYLHSPSTASGACYIRSTCIDVDVLRLQAAAFCDMGWISAQHGVLCDWSVLKKTRSIYYRRRWSLWTLAVTLLAWHSSCHMSQPVLFRATDDNPQLALFRDSRVWKNATNLQSDEKLLQFTC